MPPHTELGSNIGFWKKLRQHRRVAEISQQELSASVGNVQSTLSRREKHGGRLPSRTEVIQMATELLLNVGDKEELLATAGYSWSSDFWREITRHIAPELVNGEKPILPKSQVILIMERSLSAIRQFESTSSF